MATQQTELSGKIEDYALETVPLEERKSGWKLSWMTMGIATTLVQLLIGSYVTALAGVVYGVIAGILVAVWGAGLGYLIGRVSFHEGLSSTVVSRFYGFGAHSSFIASGIYGFMILGFLALENALLYNGTIFALGIHNTLIAQVVIYGILTLFWIVLTTFGVKQVLRVSSILTVAFLFLLLFVIWKAIADSGQSLGAVLSHGALIPGLGSTEHRFMMALVALAGSAGALALVDADYGRYARSPRDVFIMALAGAIAIDIVMVVAGTIVIYAATGYVVHYVTAHNLAPSGHPAMAYANHMAQNNTGAFFFVFASIAGFLLMYAAQAKAQVLNTYSGSLALSNFFDALLQWRPGRLAMVILGNVIGLAMIAGGILNMLQQWLGILGILTTIFVGVIAADFYIVRRGVTARRQDVEGFNAAGIVTIIVAFGISYWLQNSQSNILSLGFLDALVLSVIAYPILRLTVLKPGVLSGKEVPVKMALTED